MLEELEKLICDLVAIESVNPDLVPGGAGEGAIATFVASWLRDAGCEATVVEPVPGRPSVVGVVVSANAAPTGVCAATPNSNTSSARRAQLFFKTRPMIAPSRVQKRSVLDPLPTVLSGMCEIEG